VDNALRVVMEPAHASSLEDGDGLESNLAPYEIFLVLKHLPNIAIGGRSLLDEAVRNAFGIDDAPHRVDERPRTDRAARLLPALVAALRSHAETLTPTTVDPKMKAA
jgi:hypothetical protein